LSGHSFSGRHHLRVGPAAQAPQAPTLRTPLASTRLTAPAARDALRPPGEGEDQGPSPRPLAVGLQRRGLRRRQVIQAQPQKQSAEPAALCDQSATKPHQRWPRSRSTGCVALVKRLGRAGRSPAGGGRGAILRPVSLPWGGKNRPRPGGWWRQTVAHSASPLAVPPRRVLAAARRLRRGGRRWRRRRRWP
jgi:hypothetical protein